MRRFKREPFLCCYVMVHHLTTKVKKAVEIVKKRAPELVVDGEMQSDTAVVSEILQKSFPFASLKEAANILIFPDLNSGNPILMGMNKPVHVLQRGDDVNDIVNMAALAVVDAQNF